MMGSGINGDMYNDVGSLCGATMATELAYSTEVPKLWGEPPWVAQLLLWGRASSLNEEHIYFEPNMGAR
jgi:hypothetical protein